MKLLKNIESEKDLLASILLNRKIALKCMVELSANDFEDEINRIIFQTVLSVFKKNIPIEPIIIIHELEKMNINGIRKYVEDLTKERRKSNSHAIIRSIKEMSLRRQLQVYAHDIIESTNTENDFNKVKEILQNPPSIRGTNNKIYEMEEMLLDANQRLKEKQLSKNKIHGISTGFNELDIYTGGLKKKELSVLGARPSVGKTVLAIDIARHASKAGHIVQFFSLEMGREQLIDRVISAELLIDSNKMKYPQSMESIELEKLKKSTMEQDLKNFYVVDESSSTLGDIRAKCLELELVQGKISLVIIDYLQYMSGSGKNKRELVEENSKGLKALAKDLDIHILLISSLSRSKESFRNQLETSSYSPLRPSMSDLRESGQIEYDADNIFLLHRQKKDTNIIPTELIIEKQRNGQTGIIQLEFSPRYLTFTQRKEI